MREKGSRFFQNPMLVYLVWIAFFFQPVLLSAQWTCDSTQNTYVFGGPIYDVISDGRGGYLVLSETYESLSSPIQLSVQRVDESGYPRWGPNGATALDTVRTVHSFFPTLVSDELGGTYVLWGDQRRSTLELGPYPDSTDLYIQWIDSSGTVQFDNSGMEFARGTWLLGIIDWEAISDGAGGVIAVWDDWRHRPEPSQIYGQRMSSTGELLWEDGGQFLADIGGVRLLLPAPSHGTYAHVGFSGLLRITGAGEILWNGDRWGNMYADGLGGVLIQWRTEDDEYYMDRIDSTGTLQWSTPLTFPDSVVTLEFTQAFPGGGYAVWQDTADHFFLSQVDSTGIVWTEALSVPVNFHVYTESLHADQQGGVLITAGTRSTNGYGWDSLQVACRFGPEGTPLWGGSGVVYAVRDYNLLRRPHIVPTGTGGAVIFFTETFGGIHAQLISADGRLGVPDMGVANEPRIPEHLHLAPAYPNPFNAETRLEYHLPASTPVSIRVYDLRGRRVRALVNRQQEAGTYQVRWTGENEAGIPVASGVYFISLSTDVGQQVQKVLLLK